MQSEFDFLTGGTHVAKITTPAACGELERSARFVAKAEVRAWPLVGWLWGGSAEVIDLMALLKKSVEGKKSPKKAPARRRRAA